MKQKVTVKVNDSVEIVCNKNENLLRVLEKNGYEIEYECQEAHCGTSVSYTHLRAHET